MVDGIELLIGQQILTVDDARALRGLSELPVCLVASQYKMVNAQVSNPGIHDLVEVIVAYSHPAASLTCANSRLRQVLARIRE